MPQLGETVAEGKISKWFVSAGDAVKPGDNLFEIETDKVSMEVPAIAAGTLAAIHVQAGEVAPVGAVVAIIQGSGEHVSLSKPQAPPAPAKAAVRQEEAAPVHRPSVMEPFREVRTPARNYGPARLPGGTVVTPLARRLAGEAGIDLANLKGSGPHGRIVAADIESAKQVKAAPASTLAAASITLTADVVLAQALALCADVPAIALADIVVKAWATALQRVMPAEQSGIAVATGTSRCAIVDAASQSLTAIAAKRGSSDADTNTATTAISIPGVPGITSVADVLQPPHIAMLGIGAPRRAPIETADGAVKFVDMLTATLSCDPRTIDAARGAELLAAFKRFVEQPVTMIV